ncbi:hypothetical protein ACLOJK_008688 [Asimina triloba]
MILPRWLRAVRFVEVFRVVTVVLGIGDGRSSELERAAAISHEDLRYGGRPLHGFSRVVECQRQELRGVESAGIREGFAAQVLQAQQFLQFHQAAQYVCKSKLEAFFGICFGFRGFGFSLCSGVLLNRIAGFRKVDPEQWEFANEDFLRGQRQLLKNIHRRKPIHSHSLNNLAQGNPGALTESEKQELEEVIERLKHEKSVLLLELQRHKEEQHGMDLQMQSLEERLHEMELRQKQMMEFLMRVVQKPGFVSNLLQQSENYNKKRRLPKADYFSDDAEMVDDQHMALQAVPREKSNMVSVQVLSTDPFEKMESSISSWEKFFRGVGHAAGEEMYGSGTPWQSLAVPPSDVLPSYGDAEGNLQPQSPRICPPSPHSRDIRSSPDLTESTSFVESPAISPGHADNQVKDTRIDMNSKPASTEVQSPTERPNAGSALPAGKNDVFWEQFLTETPGSSDTQEVQSERRDSDNKKSGGKQAELGTFWWNRKNMDHLTEQMGQLSPAERT